mgnify:CR=1 FL=1
MNLDKKDKKILEILNDNARLTIAGISRKTGIQRDSVLYRVKKLKDSGVIRFFHSVLDPTVLGFPVYTFVNFSLYNLNKEDEKNAIRHLDDTRQELAKIDLRLLDCISILSGYQNVTTGNIEDFKAPKDSEDKSEKIDEKG